ncbi:all-trans-retinol 13,14-reductase [Aplysia californica]|uniref:All-trans-retinol 13,14-reductase n=1 Tax=Aplysia californica TaxID=6500 RepID=A0ABM0ZUT1_APLCA|nr:all-trans-retinol 13,14-reductase [Aplysia californica]
MIGTAVWGLFDFMLSNPLVLVTTFLLFVFVFFYYRGQKSGNNPFAIDYRRPPEPIVLDLKARDLLLKQKFKTSKVPENLDAIVIGSGIGGLSAGALLSRAGKRVLVLEQHDQAGGCCHSFVEKGFEFDTGIHYVGELHEGSDNKTLMDQLTGGQLRWSKLDDEYDVVTIGPPGKAKAFPMKTGKDRFYQNLKEMFPKDTEAIDKYRNLVTEATDSFMGVVLLKFLPRLVVRFLITSGLYKLVFTCWRKGYTTMTLQQVVDSVTNNAELKLILCYFCGDYGLFPCDAPFILHALLATHFMTGSYYPRGGTSEIGYHMSDVIQKHGGRVLVQAPVTNIICNEDGRAIGVRVGGKTKVDVYAKYIISDAGIDNTFKTLLPREIAQKSSKSVHQTQTVGINKELDINKGMTEFMTLKPDELEDAHIPFGFLSVPSAKDPEYEKKFPGKASVLLITLANWEWFEEWKDEKVRHRGERYEGIKDVVGRRMWQMCVDTFPQLEGKCVYMEVGTPVTNSYYLGFPKGEIYGICQGNARYTADAASTLRPETDIPGLYITGQDGLTAGFMGGLMNGLICSSQILNRNLYKDLQNLKKRLYPQLELMKKNL